MVLHLPHHALALAHHAVGICKECFLLSRQHFLHLTCRRIKANFGHVQECVVSWHEHRGIWNLIQLHAHWRKAVPFKFLRDGDLKTASRIKVTRLVRISKHESSFRVIGFSMRCDRIDWDSNSFLSCLQCTIATSRRTCHRNGQSNTCYHAAGSQKRFLIELPLNHQCIFAHTNLQKQICKWL